MRLLTPLLPLIISALAAWILPLNEEFTWFESFTTYITVWMVTLGIVLTIMHTIAAATGRDITIRFKG
ncbi:hypothetical protein THIOSC15_2930023 [uncultured Thiomicrorhabdus sp.]